MLFSPRKHKQQHILNSSRYVGVASRGCEKALARDGIQGSRGLGQGLALRLDRKCPVDPVVFWPCLWKLCGSGGGGVGGVGVGVPSFLSPTKLALFLVGKPLLPSPSPLMASTWSLER